LEDGDTVLFLDDGVMHIACDNLDLSCTPASEFFFSAVDLEARGLSGLPRAGVLTDADIAELIQAHTFCLTWK
jgi:sulfur transfer complex TusBCD TusB component (DsrH family)